VYDYLCFGARARVVGERSTSYWDKYKGEEIPTRIDAPLWSFHGKERPIQGGLFPPWEVPRRVEIVISRDWLRLITNPKTAQFLPLGELLGAIPPGKPACAWARVVGLALANTWRRLPREAHGGTLRLTRRELLTRYKASKAPASEVLASNDPGRAIQYWAGALAELVRVGFLDKRGEAARGAPLLKLGPNGQELPRKGWQDTWLDTEVDLYPGPKMKEPVRLCAENLPPPPLPKVLNEPPKKRVGRPRKAQARVASE
jgi:hypothetical protein